MAQWGEDGGSPMAQNSKTENKNKVNKKENKALQYHGHLSRSGESPCMTYGGWYMGSGMLDEGLSPFPGVVQQGSVSFHDGQNGMHLKT